MQKVSCDLVLAFYSEPVAVEVRNSTFWCPRALLPLAAAYPRGWLTAILEHVRGYQCLLDANDGRGKWKGGPKKKSGTKI